MPITYDPNEHQKHDVWATYIPWRNPKFKTHSQRSHALSACMHHGTSEFILYKWEDDKWLDVVRWEEPFPERECYVCQEKPRDKYSSFPKRAWVNKKDPVPTMTYLCWEHVRCP